MATLYNSIEGGRRAKAVLVALLLASLPACASTEAPAAAATPYANRALAERLCGQCHAVGQTGESRSSAAPPLWQVRLRYNAVSFERLMDQIAVEGHYEMPPVRLSKDEMARLWSYVETLSPS